jgi:hypothetical protein
MGKLLILVFWAVVPCCNVGGCRSFVGTYRFHLQGGSCWIYCSDYRNHTSVNNKRLASKSVYCCWLPVSHSMTSEFFTAVQMMVKEGGDKLFRNVVRPVHKFVSWPRGQWLVFVNEIIRAGGQILPPVYSFSSSISCNKYAQINYASILWAPEKELCTYTSVFWVARTSKHLWYDGTLCHSSCSHMKPSFTPQLTSFRPPPGYVIDIQDSLPPRLLGSLLSHSMYPVLLRGTPETQQVEWNFDSSIISRVLHYL